MDKFCSEETSKVFLVRSFKHIKRIISCQRETRFKYSLTYIYVSLLVLMANTCLTVAKFFLFKKRGYAQQEFHRIVVYTVGILGDTVSILPALASLRNRYPNAIITVISNCQIWSSQSASALLGNSAFVDNLIIVKKLDCPVQRHGWHFTLDVPELKNISCDLFVNFSPFGNRGWLGAVAREMILAKKLGAHYAVGFHMNSYSSQGLLNKVYHLFIKNEPRRHADIISELGLEIIENVDLLTRDNEARQRVLKILKERGNNRDNFFVINPGAKLKAQCWPADRFGEIAKTLAAKYNATVFVTGIPSERSLADEVVNASGGVAINLAGETTVQELVELIREAKGCITNDTGTTHIAAMVGVPTVAIFSIRQSPTHWFPLGKNVIALFSMVNCKFCYDDECAKINCLKMIETQHVEDALEKLIGKR